MSTVMYESERERERFKLLVLSCGWEGGENFVTEEHEQARRGCDGLSL